MYAGRSGGAGQSENETVRTASGDLVAGIFRMQMDCVDGAGAGSGCGQPYIRTVMQVAVKLMGLRFQQFREPSCYETDSASKMQVWLVGRCAPASINNAL